MVFLGLILASSASLANDRDAAGASDAPVSARAQVLFDRAVALMETGNYAEACPKLEESHALDPGGGTALNLGYCWERLGKLGSAHTAYEEAQRLAARDGRSDREQLARQKLQALAPRLTFLKIVLGFSARSLDALEVRLDGRNLPPSSFERPVPIDAGRHVLEVTALHKRPFVQRIEVGESAGILEIEVNHLEDGGPSRFVARAPIASAARGAPAVGVQPRPKPAFWVAGASSLVLLAAGGTAGIIALHRHEQSDRLCPGNACSARGVEAEEQANTYAWIANVGIGAGLAAAGIAAYIWLSQRDVPRSGAARGGSIALEF